MDFAFLAKTPFFRTLRTEEIKSALTCLGAVTRHFEKAATFTVPVTRSTQSVLSSKAASTSPTMTSGETGPSWDRPTAGKYLPKPMPAWMTSRSLSAWK